MAGQYKTGYRTGQEGTLYLILNPTEEILKIGISNNLPQRLRKHYLNGFTTVVGTAVFKDGAKAMEYETAIKRVVRDLKSTNNVVMRIDGKKFDGHAESWPRTIFPVETLKELISMVDASA